MDYSEYYQSIIKPFFAPPEWLFGLAWGTIYPLMLIAIFYLIYLVAKNRLPKMLLYVYVINIIANLLFTPLQLSVQSTILATLDILIVLGTLIYLEFKFWRESKIIFLLLLPYLLWGAFATVLQVAILFLNL
jgi:translocator protein